MPPRGPAKPLITAHSQPLIAAATTALLVAGAIWFVTAGGLNGQLVHHDAAPTVDNRFTININATSETELAQLPGLGATMARRIIDHRREHGPFATLDGLLDVPGIGPATLAAMRPYLRPIRQRQPDLQPPRQATPTETTMPSGLTETLLP
jgi:competence ComEA-like helix-hairpin-helix protein